MYIKKIHMSVCSCVHTNNITSTHVALFVSQVGDLALNMADGDDARLQLCYEPERIVDARLK